MKTMYVIYMTTTKFQQTWVFGVNLDLHAIGLVLGVLPNHLIFVCQKSAYTLHPYRIQRWSIGL